MKKITVLMFAIFLCIGAYSQDSKDDPAKTGKRFFAGISYSYMSIDMKLSDLTLSSEWYGSDLGSIELTDDEIDDLNGFTDRTTTINAVTLLAGMALLNKPESDWKMNGTLFLGIAQNLTDVENNLTGIREYSFNSGFSKPLLGIGFDVDYKLTDHWGLSLRPYAIGSMGNTTDVEDLINPDPINFRAEKEDKYQTLYLRGSLFAAYTAGPVTLYAGPGLYYCWSKHAYRRQYTSTETGKSIIEKNTSVTVPENFIDGSIAVFWKIIEPLTLYVHAGVGQDVMIDAGVHYSF